MAIHHARSTGGQDRYALELARRLAERCELSVVAFSVEGALPPGVTVRWVLGPARPLLLAAPLFRRRAAKLLRGRRYDLVHAVGGALPGAHVITAQFCHAEWRRVQRSATLYQRLVTAQAVRHEREAYRHHALRAVIAVSHRTAEEIKRHYGPLSVPVTVIPNAVDAGTFKPSLPRAPRGARARLLFVGAFARKGLDTAIRALALMREPAELLAVGDGSRDRYLTLARELRVADRVRFEHPRPDIQTRLASADAFVFPTRYEPFGMVIAEALASGVPVVTSAVAGAAELIRDGESGVAIPDPEDAGAFAAALDAVVGDEPRRREMAYQARMAIEGLTWDMVAERTLEVYRSVA